MNLDPILAQASAQSLLAWWKILLMLLPFFPWAWLISSSLGKDAKYFHFNHFMWSGIYLGTGLAAFAAMLGIPIFWAGWPVGILVLWTPIVVYWQYRNRNVPAEHRFHLSAEGIRGRLDAAKKRKATRQSLLRFASADGQEKAAPQKDSPLYQVHMLAEDLIGPALAARCSRLELVVGSGGCAVSQLLDGVRIRRPNVPTDSAVPLIDYLKEMAGLDVQDRRRKQTAQMRLHGPEGETELSYLTYGSSNGHVLLIDFDRSKRLNIPFDSLGLLPAQLEALRAFEQPHERHGLMLIGAPTGHGLSTSIYSFLRRHDAYTSNIKTLEREITLPIEGVDQATWDPSDPDVDYATGLQSILRRDPDIVMTGRIRDTETARVLIEPGMDGPLIYIPQRAGSIAKQIRDWVKVVGDVRKAAQSLRCVTNQRLLRRLCPNCRQPFQPTADQLKKLGLPADRAKQLYRPGGKVQVKNKIENCPVCQGVGYLGQVGAFEVMIVRSSIRRLLAAGDLKGAWQEARRKKMILLQEAALGKVLAGETSIEEVVRVTSSDAKSGSGAQSAA